MSTELLSGHLGGSSFSREFAVSTSGLGLAPRDKAGNVKTGGIPILCAASSASLDDVAAAGLSGTFAATLWEEIHVSQWEAALPEGLEAFGLRDWDLVFGRWGGDPNVARLAGRWKLLEAELAGYSDASRAQNERALHHRVEQKVSSLPAAFARLITQELVQGRAEDKSTAEVFAEIAERFSISVSLVEEGYG